MGRTGLGSGSGFGFGLGLALGLGLGFGFGFWSGAWGSGSGSGELTLERRAQAAELSELTLGPGFCDADDPYFVLYGAAVLAPILSICLLPAFLVLFQTNINPTALQQARPANPHPDRGAGPDP